MRASSLLGFLVIAINLIIVLLVLVFDSQLEGWMRTVYIDGAPVCLSSWSNASLLFRTDLKIIQPISLFASGLIFLITIISRLIESDISEKRGNQVHPLASFLIGLLSIWIWVCWIGSITPVESLQELGYVSRFLFNNIFGIFFAVMVLGIMWQQIGNETYRILKRTIAHGRVGKYNNR
jgi:hypothetical protein